MMASTLLSGSCLRGSASQFGARRPFTVTSPVIKGRAIPARCSLTPKQPAGKKVEDASISTASNVALPIAAALAAGLVLMPALYPESAEAARSGGRVGGSQFRAAPAPAPSGGGGGGGTVVRNYNYYGGGMSVAPPVYGGFGWGWAPAPVILMGGSGIFNILIFFFFASIVVSVISGLLNRGKRDDFYDD